MIVVDVHGGGDFTEIQHALDAAIDGDAVLVRPGEYVIESSLDFNRLRNQGDPSIAAKSLHLFSELGRDFTSIRLAPAPDAPEEGLPVVEFGDRFTPDSISASTLEGFTLTGGTNGAVRAENVSGVTLSLLRITGNVAPAASSSEFERGAILARGFGKLIVADCQITDNSTHGVYVSPEAFVELRRCLISHNSGHGVLVRDRARASLAECDLIDNQLTGISTYVEEPGRASLRSCRVSGNDTGCWGNLEMEDCAVTRNRSNGVAGSDTDIMLRNCVVSWNGGFGLTTIGASVPRVTQSTLTGNALGGIFSWVSHPKESLVENCILRDNGGPSLSGSEGDPPGFPPRVIYCCTNEVVPGEGNIAVDPLFCEGLTGKSLALSLASPCIGRGARGETLGAATGTCGETVVDDGGPGAGSSDPWLVSGAPSPYGERSLYSHEAGARYSYTLHVPEAGEYDIFLWWTQWPSRLTGVPVEIEQAGGKAIVHANQRQKGGQWNLLGRWKLDGLARVTILSPGGGSTCADAVKIVPAGGATDLILDNGAPGTASSGYWPASGANGAFGKDSVYSRERGTTYSYTFEVPSAGKYRVFFWWTQYSSRSSHVAVSIDHALERSWVYVDQRTLGGRWNDLGIFDFDHRAQVTVLSSGNGVSTSADAVKLEPLGAFVPEEIIVDNGAPGTSSMGSWALSGGANSYGSRSLYSREVGATYIFDVPVPASGEYEVFLWWTEYSSRRTEVPVVIRFQPLATTSANVDQRTNGGRWVSLGTWPVVVKVTLTVRSLGGGTTCADAVRLVRKS